MPLEQVLRPAPASPDVLLSRGRLCLYKRFAWYVRGPPSPRSRASPGQHNTHPGSKLKKDGRVIPHGEESGLAPRSLAELLHSTAVFPCFQMEQELLDLLYHSEGGRVDKIMRERDESPRRKEFHHYLWVLVSFLVAVAPEIAPQSR